MTPYAELARRLSPHLERAGLRPLDVWRDAIGGDRHGIYDYTWVSPHPDGRHCYASLFISHGGGEGSPEFAEVWGAVEEGPRSPTTLVLHLEPMFSDAVWDLELRLQVAMLEAARRAELLRRADAAERAKADPRAPWPKWLGMERAPYRVTVAAVGALFEQEPERIWRNSEVLTALLERDFRTDRTHVNAALSLLYRVGVIRRVRRGAYRGV